MKKYLLLLFVGCFAQAAQKNEPTKPSNLPVATHGMAIVFGYVPEQQYATSADIEPFVLNPFTGNLENSGVVTRLADLFNQQKAYILTNSSLFRAMIKRYPNIKLADWRCRAISDFVYIFVQNSLLPPENVQNPYAQVPDFEAIEPYLGVKISDKATISTEELRSVYYSKMPSKNLAEECTNILSCFWDGKLSKIFLIKSDYEKNTYQKMNPVPITPTWALLLLGFGQQSDSLVNPNGLVCGLTIPIFRQILDFFTTQLNIGMAIVSSSYFADINLVASLKEDDNKKPLKKSPFILITTDITAAPLLSGLHPEETRDYNKFFTRLLPPPTLDALRVNWQPNVKDFENTIAIVCHPYRYFVGAEERFTTPAAIPSMRLKNEQFFVPAHFDGNVVVVTDSLMKPGLEKEPLYLKTLMNSSKKNGAPVPDTVLLTCSKNFTRPLMLTARADGKLPTIIGINPGPYVYVFDEINAQGHGISAIINAFLRLPNLEQDRAFIIKKLHAINDVAKLVTVNKPQAEKTFFELKVVHTRSEVIGGENKNMVIIKQFDCTHNCVAKITAQTPEPPAARPITSTEQQKSQLTTQQTSAAQPTIKQPVAPVVTQETKPMGKPTEKPMGQPPLQNSQQRPAPELTTQKPTDQNYSVVAAAQGTLSEKIELRWSATSPTTVPDAIDTVISKIKSKQIPTTLGLFAT